MPFNCCGLPCFSKKEQRHQEQEKIVEKPIVVAVRSNNLTTVSTPRPVTRAEQPPAVIPTEANKVKDQVIEEKPSESILSNPNITTPQPPTNEDPAMADQLKGAVGGVTSGVQQTASTAQDTATKGGEQLTSGAKSAGGAVTGQGQGTEHWDAMTEEQKKATFDALPEEKKKGLSYYEWVMQGYQHQKENWMPWIEDMYLKWFTKDNKASYATKDTLNKSKITGIEQVDNLQDGVNNLAAGQVGQGGLLQPAGDMVSKEGVNRAERGGKDESGSYAGAIGSSVSSAGGSLWNGAKSAGGYVGGFLPGGKKAEAEQK